MVRAQRIGFAIFAVKTGFAAGNRDARAEQGQAADSAVVGRAIVVSAAIVAAVPARSDVSDREDGLYSTRSAGLCGSLGLRRRRRSLSTCFRASLEQRAHYPKHL